MLACAATAVAQEEQPTGPQQQPATRVVATFIVHDGDFRKAKHGLTLTIAGFSARAGTKAEDLPLRGRSRFRQKTSRYLATWRRETGDDSRRAVLTLNDGERIALNLSHPRIRSGHLIVHAGQADRRAVVSATAQGSQPQEFARASLRVASNWYPIVARLSANSGYNRCISDKWRGGAPWSCTGTGEAQNTGPWNLGGRWTGTDGGRNFTVRGSMRVAISGTPPFAYYVTHDAVLNGTSGGWGTRQVTINSSSYYNSLWGSVSRCTKHPVSGGDDSLVGQPGGPLRTDIRYAGTLFYPYYYILDVRGYVSEPFPPPQICHF